MLRCVDNFHTNRFKSCKFVAALRSPLKSNLVSVVRKPLKDSRGIIDFRRLLFKFNDLQQGK